MWTEAEVLTHWQSIDAFATSLELSKDNPKFVFYDGPPFATGLPHYGHLVASTIKDIFGRYKTQTGYHVERRWGWDTHGLPIEYKIEEELGIKTKQQVLTYGIDNYNQACRDIVLKYRSQWKETIDKLGRWVDMDNDYKTMDPVFMNSVWWAFKTIFDQGQIYRGYKVTPYSMACATPLSNFEAKSNYKDVSDWSIIIKFKTTLGYLLVWTTTPWTLPTNLILCVHPELEYVCIEYQEETYILARNCIKNIFKKKVVKITKTIQGQDLVGLNYTPVFNYYTNWPNAFRVLSDGYVQADEGTGIVHCAPAHGEDDYRVCLENNIISKVQQPPCPLDENCNFTAPVNEWLGQNVKAVEKDIIKFLGDKVLFKYKITHSYPFCWRSNTPLIYKVCECWYMDVISMRDELVANNNATSWLPDHIGKNRFGNWLAGATDWCLSRNRFWGTPMPIWTNEDQTETVCIGSVAELEKLAKLEPGSVKDLHRDSIDHITIPSQSGEGVLRRVEYVFDCWFESGSMPYAQNGYMGKGDIPAAADFIAEGLDQTRGWFYTLLVLGTALHKRSPFKHVIVNGIVLNDQSEKMSKSKRNYPPVDKVLTKYGADALRLYLINTQVVRAGNIKFREEDVQLMVRQYHLMMRNALKFYFEMIGLYEQQHEYEFSMLSDLDAADCEVIDHWILECLNDLFVLIHQKMQTYDLSGVVDKLLKFIDQLSRWYVNLNKNRLKSCNTSLPLNVLGNCFYYFALISAPFAPFLAESIYQQLRPLHSKWYDIKSIHFQRIPTDNIWQSDGKLLQIFDYFSTVVDLVRVIRAKRQVSTSAKLALPHITIVHTNAEILSGLKLIDNYIKKELNIEEISYAQDIKTYVNFTLAPDIYRIKNQGIDGRNIGKIVKHFKQLPLDEAANIVERKVAITIDDFKLDYDNIQIQYVPSIDNVLIKDNLVLNYQDHVTAEIYDKYIVKLFYRGYQKARKDASLVQTDIITLYYSAPANIVSLLQKYYPEYQAVTSAINNCIYSCELDLEIGKVAIYLV